MIAIDLYNQTLENSKVFELERDIEFSSNLTSDYTMI
jgi:hypothetical protein